MVEGLVKKRGKAATYKGLCLLIAKMRAIAKTTFFISLVSTAAFTSCSGIERAQVDLETSNRRQETARDKQIKSSEKNGWVEYEPSVVELKGKLVIKTFFGPPNFGESPETDSKERSWILSLNKPINVRGKTGPDAGYEGNTAEDVNEIQLVLLEPHREFIGKNVIVKGTLFYAHTGHHHTDVLMQVQSIGLVRCATDRNRHPGRDFISRLPTKAGVRIADEWSKA